METSSIIDKTINYVQQTLKNSEGGHDWWHTHRVYLNAQKIASGEPEIDTEVVLLAALLHDIADSKFNNGNEQIGPDTARLFLSSEGFDSIKINHVVSIIENISFKGGKSERTFHSKELDIVQDADRLDAIGAIGIARAFNYGGFKGNEIYNPEIPPNLEMTKEEYKKGKQPSVNHFYEKLLLLKDLMNTKTGREMAQQRHEFMLEYLDQFYREVNE
ncbi:MAG: HD domain-containing protein [Bacteroidia bacterium]|nr:HD domain-containing protein [Bacteroidia bacterium]